MFPFIVILPGPLWLWFPLSGSCFPAGPFLPEPEEEDVDRYADDREDQNDREELRHADQRRIIGETVAEALGAAEHLGADGGEQAEDRPDHQPDDDHRHR